MPSHNDKARNCQIVIDTLSREVLETDLAHICGKDIIDGHIASIGNLLEIFYGLLEYVYEDLQKEEVNNLSAGTYMLLEIL